MYLLKHNMAHESRSPTLTLSISKSETNLSVALCMDELDISTPPTASPEGCYKMPNIAKGLFRKPRRNKRPKDKGIFKMAQTLNMHRNKRLLILCLPFSLLDIVFALDFVVKHLALSIAINVSFFRYFCFMHWFSYSCTCVKVEWQIGVFL